MDFTRQDEEEEEDSDNPPPAPPPPPPSIRSETALGRPMLSPSASLLSPRGRGGGGGGGGGGGAIRNEMGPSSPNYPTASSSRGTDSSSSAGAVVVLRYRECLRNHAASLGGHVLDGCCEFMPSSEDAFKCAACGCHRSFHRIDGESPPSHPNPDSLYRFNDVVAAAAPHGRSPLLLPPLFHPPPDPTSHRHHHHHHHQKQFISPAIPIELRSSNSPRGGSGTMTESSSDHQERNVGAGPPQRPYMLSKKRFRTKFTTEQKERMLDFAERLGWRIQKQDEALVEEFCAQVGVSRQVLKVWMHNNKNSAIRKQQQQQQQQQQQEHQDM